MTAPNLKGTAQNGATGIVTHTHSLYAGTAAGDVVAVGFNVGFNNNQGVDVTVTDDSGTWTKVDEGYEVGTDASFKRASNLAVFIKVQPGTPDSSITCSDGVVTASWSAVSATYSGVDTSTPQDATNSKTSSGSGSAADPGAITTGNNDAIAISFIAYSLEAGTWTQPTGYGNKVIAAGGFRSIVGFADKTVTSAGSENPGTWGFTIYSSVDAWIAITIALKAAAGGGNTGTASITEAGDTGIATGTLAITGTGSITEAGDTGAATGVLPIVGTTSVTEAGDTVSATGSSENTGTATITEANDTATATGVLPITGVGSATEGGDTVTATGQGPTASQGVVDVTEQNDTLVATGHVEGAEIPAVVPPALTGGGGRRRDITQHHHDEIVKRIARELRPAKPEAVREEPEPIEAPPAQIEVVDYAFEPLRPAAPSPVRRVQASFPLPDVSKIPLRLPSYEEDDEEVILLAVA